MEATEFSNTLDFSTDQADYHLHITPSHSASSDIGNIVEEVDAIVVETGTGKYEDISLPGLANQTQYSNFMEENFRADEPSNIFLADIPINEEWIRPDMFFKEFIPSAVTIATFQNNPITGLLAAPYASNLACKGRAMLGWGGNETIDKVVSYSRVSAFLRSAALRSAVTAAKIEEFIAPLVTEEKNHKPEILIEYGGSHADIFPYLKHPALREKVTSLHKELKYSIDPGLDVSYSDKVGEFKFHEDGKMIYPHNNEAGTELIYDKIIHEKI